MELGVQHLPKGDESLVAMAAEIIAAYVSHNSVKTTEIQPLLESVYATLTALSRQDPVYAGIRTQMPAVDPADSIQDGYLICLEDGRKMTMLKRHLKTKYNMTPQQYRAKWNLPGDYPMVAPSYSKKRSKMAKDHGLGYAKKKRKNLHVAA